MKTKNAQQPKDAVPQIDTSFLLSKVNQSASVRSTFTLTPEAAKTLDALSEQASITQREVFDQAFSYGWFDLFAKKLKESPPQEDRSERRTLVLSAKALEQLQKSSKEYGIKRDDLAGIIAMRMLKFYSESVKTSKEAWLQIFSAMQEAISAAIDYEKAFESIKASSIPDAYRKSVEECVGKMLNYLADECANLESDIHFLLKFNIGEELTDLRDIADNLVPINPIWYMKDPEERRAYYTKLLEDLNPEGETK